MLSMFHVPPTPVNLIQAMEATREVMSQIPQGKWKEFNGELIPEIIN